jgi:hypothetical protein
MVEARIQTQFAQQIEEIALIAEVVNGDRALYPEKSRIVREIYFQIGRQQTSLPVVRMQDIRRKCMPGHVERSLAQQGEADVIVDVIEAALVVQACAIVERGAIHEEVADAIMDGLVYPNRKPARTHTQQQIP